MARKRSTIARNAVVGLGVLVALALAQLFGPAQHSASRERRKHEPAAPNAHAEHAQRAERAEHEKKPRTHGTRVADVFAADSPWSSPEACEAAWQARKLGKAKRAPGKARIGTWNLAWFPDGVAHGPAPEHAKDVRWLGCVIALLDVDVLAVQEVVQHTRGRAAWLDLEKDLSARTGGDFDSALDECPDDGRQHVGFLYDKQHVTLSDVEQLRELNPGKSACAQNLRPGLAATLRWKGGLDLRAVALHLDSGPTPRDYDHRTQSIAALHELLPKLTHTHHEDLVVLGDWNTMGCETCTPAVEAATEITALDTSLSDTLQRLPATHACSEYYAGHGGLLDHVLVTKRTRELPQGAKLETHGVCEALKCGAISRGQLAALAHLSDHCPLVLELDDKDLD